MTWVISCCLVLGFLETPPDDSVKEPELRAELLSRRDESKPLEGEANVDKLCAEMDLPPIAEYARSFDKIYNGTEPP
jgi:hypothetical protein